MVSQLDTPLSVSYGATVHGRDEIDAVVSVLETSTQLGKHVKAMEQGVSALFAKSAGIMVNSGSSANYLAVEILNLPKGSEVITPALTFGTTVAPLVQHGLIPAFIDVERDTFNANVDQIESMINPKTKALFIPNLLGNLPNWSRIRALADEYELVVVEDSADTLGATLHGQSSGFFSDISTTSFYGSHIINCAGNGGMLCVNDRALQEKALLLRSWGRSSSLFEASEAIENRFHACVDGIPYDAKFIFEAMGYNFEPSEMGAAFGLVQLSKLEQAIEQRIAYFEAHYQYFKAYEEWFILPQQCPNSRTAWLAFPLIVRDTAPFSRTDLQIYLEQHRIQTRTVFTGNILRQPGFVGIPHRASSEGYPCADYVMRGGILLGCHQGLTNAKMAYIQTVVDEFMRGV